MPFKLRARVQGLSRLCQNDRVRLFPGSATNECRASRAGKVLVRSLATVVAKRPCLAGVQAENPGCLAKIAGEYGERASATHSL
jgi:hypothetical protein